VRTCEDFKGIIIKMQPDFQPSFEKFINTINKEQARDLVRSINLWVFCSGRKRE